MFIYPRNGSKIPNKTRIDEKSSSIHSVATRALLGNFAK